ncbi:MAG: hypothetical protein JOZ81_00240 [Chloroflexi bacterium]|nr:hypothetical protein [Chloroflexota bacterium]MBV9546455.1 hypothetical protein [Chloroflexota bacterium]
MKYMLMFCKSEADDRRFDAMTDQERAELFRQVDEWQTENRASFVEPGYRLERSRAATTVRRKQDGQVMITDGPFVEGGEVVGGYSIVDVPDLDVALRIARTFPACPTVEIRPVID